MLLTKEEEFAVSEGKVNVVLEYSAACRFWIFVICLILFAEKYGLPTILILGRVTK